MFEFYQPQRIMFVLVKNAGEYDNVHTMRD